MIDRQGGGRSSVPATLAWTDVEYYLARGRSATLPMNTGGSPVVDYVVFDEDIALQVELLPGHRPPRSVMPTIRVEQVISNGVRMARLRTTDPELRRDFHDLVCAIADRIVRKGEGLDRAFHETVGAWSELVRRMRPVDAEERLGLLGELMVLHCLGEDEEIGWSTAVDGWVGRAAEEHDFSLVDFDVEVKTTSTERRVHRIHGTGQLTPKPGRPLWLVSLQVTRGGTSGVTLGQCLARVRERLRDGAPERLRDFDDHLDRFRSRPQQEDDERWLLRSEALVLPVDDELPRIDDALLEGLSPAQRGRLHGLRYEIDLTGLRPSGDPPDFLTAVSMP